MLCFWGEELNISAVSRKMCSHHAAEALVHGAYTLQPKELRQVSITICLHFDKASSRFQ